MFETNYSSEQIILLQSSTSQNDFFLFIVNRVIVELGITPAIISRVAHLPHEKPVLLNVQSPVRVTLNVAALFENLLCKKKSANPSVQILRNGELWCEMGL